MTTFIGNNGLATYFQAAGVVEGYALDQVLTEPAVFKLKTATPSGDVKVTFADGTTDTLDCDRLDALNAQVTKVWSAGIGILIADFGLYR